jgi:alpha 1,6-mannosyltransferase
MMAVVEDIVESVAEVAKANKVSISQLKMDMIGNVVDLTGPRRFARSVTKSVGSSLINETGRWDSWNDYYEILEPKLAGDVLILPGYSFAGFFNTYKEEGQDRLGPSLVVHHYAGSWKNEYGGEKVKEQAQT